jgi:hypothetical protein
MDHDELVKKYEKLQNDFGGMCTLFRVQQEALEKLGAVVDAHQRLFEAQSGYQPPNPGNAPKN